MTKKTKPVEFGKRLKSARKMAGLSMEELASASKGIVTKQAISKYENGIMKPSSEVLIQLSKTLGINAEYFFRKFKMELSGIRFRKNFKMSSKKLDSLKQKTLDFLERYLELENILGLEIKFQNPVKDIPISSFSDIEKAAQKIREKWKLGLSPLSNLLDLLEKKGIKVFQFSDIPGFDGLSAGVEGRRIIVINKDLPPDRIRFTAALELAHILFHFTDNPKTEKLCHEFAGAFLLPKAVLEEQLMRFREHITLWELGEIKKIYGISMQAIVKRTKSLGIVSDFYFRNFQEMLNRKKWKIVEPIAYTGQEKALRFKHLLHYAVSENIITLNRGAELANKNILDFQDEVRSAV
jgi:Zn-dependent peptidase ImmA (M78 family)